jgi:hypothetical protein
MHPLYRPVVLIIWLCCIIIGLNVLAFWWIQERIPATRFASSQVDHTPVPLAGPPVEVAHCEPAITVDETPLAERDAAIAQLKAEVDRLNSVRGDDATAWRIKADQLEQELTMLQQVAERVINVPDARWQEGKLMLAHALVKEKT